MKPWNNGNLISTADGHALQHENGTPFFYLADTAWDLFHRLTPQEANIYFKTRAEQGFNVIQTVLISEFFNWNPSISGQEPFLGRDVSKPNDAFFSYVKSMVRLAGEHGLYVMLLPTWAEFVTMRVENIPIFTNEADAYAYGAYLGTYFSDCPNVLWCMGGDRLPDEQPWGIAVWRAMANGVAYGLGRIPFMTFHCHDSSSRWFHDDEWITMHMWGSYHTDPCDPVSYQFAHADYALQKPKPTLNGEPCYENSCIHYADGAGRFTARDVRRHAYWSVFAGACGHTYGAYEIFALYNHTRSFIHADGRDVTAIGTPQNDWQTALWYDGAMQMCHLKHLIEEKLPKRKCANHLLADNGCSGPMHMEAQASPDETRLLVYLPAKRRLTIKENAYTSCAWFSPVTGVTTPAAACTGQSAFYPPFDQDSVLILEK